MVGSVEDELTVAVPASCANLGPGFDALAVAVDLRLVVRATEPGDRRVIAEGEGAGELPAGDDNLIWRGVCAYCDLVGAAPPQVSLRAHNPIPLERGMGSSAAAAVAGVALGRALVGGRASAADLVRLAAELEGHGDNAAAAVLGGVVVCHDSGCRRLEPTDALQPVLCVPAARQSTVAARGLLPEQVPLADAAANAARAAAVVAGLCGLCTLEVSAMTDVLHEPPRLAAMSESGALVAALRAAGIPACLSGAGPSVLAVVGRRDQDAVAVVRQAAGEGFTVQQRRWDRAGATVRLPGLQSGSAKATHEGG